MMWNFFDSIEILSLIQNWAVAIGIVIGFVWGLKMIRWDYENEPLKTKLKVGVYTSTIYALIIFIVGLRINYLDGIKSSKLENNFNEIQNLKTDLGESSQEIKTIRDSLKLALNERAKIDNAFNIKSKTLEIRNEKLDTRTKQREVPKEKIEELINALSPYKGNKIQITSLMSDPETIFFASQLESIFQKSGWDVLSSSFQNIAPVMGIYINIKDKEFARKASFILTALKNAGLNLKIGGIDKFNIQNEIEILVGTNPNKVN